MRSRPSAISFTRLTYSSAISLKMSFAPHAPCILSTMGDCATEIIGAVSAAAPATLAPRNLRRAGLSRATGALKLLWSVIVCLLMRLASGWRVTALQVPARTPTRARPAHWVSRHHSKAPRSWLWW